MTASHDRCVMCASCGLDREDGSRARGIELVGVEVADVMVRVIERVLISCLCMIL